MKHIRLQVIGRVGLCVVSLFLMSSLPKFRNSTWTIPRGSQCHTVCFVRIYHGQF